MVARLRNITLAALLAAFVLALCPAPAQGDDYWNNYWGWYDNTYRPYYYRQYSYARPYNYAYPYGYGGYSYGPGAYSYGMPYGGYYGTRNFGYSNYGPYGGAVSVGPLRFGWR